MNHTKQFTTALPLSEPETVASTAALPAQFNGNPTHLPFEAPTLAKHGSVAALTQDFGGSFDPGPP